MRMRGTKAGFVASFLAVLGCRGAPELQFDLPSDIAFVVLVQTDVEGIQRASALMRRGPEGLALTTRSGRTNVVGFTENDLRSAGLVDAFEESESVALDVVTDCTPALPTPSYVGRWEDDRIARAEDDVPSLSAPWIQQACGSEIEEPLVRLDCIASGCSPNITRQSPCRFRVDARACGGPSAEMLVAASGDICMLSEATECRDVDDPLVAGRLDCPDCSVESFVVEAPKRFDVETISIVDQALRVPGTVTANFSVHSRALRDGVIFDVVALDDRLVVSAGAPGTFAQCPGEELIRKAHFTFSTPRHSSKRVAPTVHPASSS